MCDFISYNVVKWNFLAIKNNNHRLRGNMEKLVIEGGRPLSGTINVSGSKNAALPILFAAILMDGKTALKNVPNLRDIQTTLNLLNILGVKSQNGAEGITLEVDNLKPEAPYDLVRTMRASVLCLGPLLARLGEARVALPGGCAIGARPVDQHLKALEAMGAKFELTEGNIYGRCSRLHGAKVRFDFPTVGGTENILMAAVLADGETVIENAACEPEIADLANFLIAAGARIEGHGTSVIKVGGLPSLADARHSVMPDRIEAGTFIIAAAMTKSRLKIKNCPVSHLEAVVNKLTEMGLKIEALPDGMKVDGTAETRCCHVKTEPFPGFPTDMQAQIMALMCVSGGEGEIEESIFENRFMHVQELVRLGAKIKINGSKASIQGAVSLEGAPVMASDLRASASLVLAGLGANGHTEVLRIYHLDRGYEQIENKLNAVGANIKRVKAN